MAFQVKVEPVLVEVHLILPTCSVSANSLLCLFGKNGSRPFDFHEPKLGVFLSQPSSLSPQESQLHVSFLLRLCVMGTRDPRPRKRHCILVAAAMLRSVLNILQPYSPPILTRSRVQQYTISYVCSQV